MRFVFVELLAHTRYYFLRFLERNGVSIAFISSREVEKIACEIENFWTFLLCFFWDLIVFVLWDQILCIFLRKACVYKPFLQDIRKIREKIIGHLYVSIFFSRRNSIHKIIPQFFLNLFLVFLWRLLAFLLFILIMTLSVLNFLFISIVVIVVVHLIILFGIVLSVEPPFIFLYFFYPFDHFLPSL